MWLKQTAHLPAMALARGYGPERLKAAAEKTVDKAKGEIKNDLGDVFTELDELSCRYVGADCDGAANPDAKAKKTSLLHFQWRISWSMMRAMF